MKTRTLFLLIGCVLSYGCDVLCPEYDTAECGQSPNLPIEAFEVTITTGDEATDMNIHLCWYLKSDSQSECAYLDYEWHDDFEAWQTDSFTVGLDSDIEVGDLESFYIYNSGGGFFEYSWEIAGLTLEAILPDGSSWLLYDESHIRCHNILNQEEVYTPLECPY